jgi:GNAT superfamily N-acetyltransferase
MDSGFIISSWPKNAYFSAAEPIHTKKDKWFRAFYEHVKHHLAHSEITIACSIDAPYAIFGYSIVDKEILEFVYVKELYRKQGIATMLVPERIKEFRNITKIGKSILDNRKLKEEREENGKTQDSRDEYRNITLLHSETH